ncbi:hypothetical protein PanWU01x14_206260 [Parasponia andersonii]|uniref:Retrovirus-related Pol polyprotein from transposon TNT 1-94-like beta-barrel domain-containing protein n=1 Tax=Parasponia andersonii TaxID=3476 RepID=A0A2P5BVY2_PARAD|nr:hypothetical protein PanWU01x14_206260 [Parasponia andersonii]
MTQSSHGFVSYSPCPSNKKVATADGTFITVASQGDATTNSILVLKNVLHVPKLSTNLVSVHKFTKDLDCVVTFSSRICQIQDQDMGRMIRLAKAKNGLYILEEPSGQNSTKNQIPLSLFSELSFSNKNQI